MGFSRKIDIISKNGSCPDEELFSQKITVLSCELSSLFTKCESQVSQRVKQLTKAGLIAPGKRSFATSILICSSLMGNCVKQNESPSPPPDALKRSLKNKTKNRLSGQGSPSSEQNDRDLLFPSFTSKQTVEINHSCSTKTPELAYDPEVEDYYDMTQSRIIKKSKKVQEKPQSKTDESSKNKDLIPRNVSLNLNMEQVLRDFQNQRKSRISSKSSLDNDGNNNQSLDKTVDKSIEKHNLTAIAELSATSSHRVRRQGKQNLSEPKYGSYCERGKKNQSASKTQNDAFFEINSPSEMAKSNKRIAIRQEAPKNDSRLGAGSAIHRGKSILSFQGSSSNQASNFSFTLTTGQAGPLVVSKINYLRYAI